jgi:hypothetical protein
MLNLKTLSSGSEDENKTSPLIKQGLSSYCQRMEGGKTGLSSYCQQTEGDKNWSLFLMPAYERQQEPVFLFFARVWKATRTGLFSYCQCMEDDMNQLFSSYC